MGPGRVPLPVHGGHPALLRPKEVFHNILSLALDWPEGEEALSPKAFQVSLVLL